MESLAQIGVQLLLFALGLEFSLSKLRAVRSVALVGETPSRSPCRSCRFHGGYQSPLANFAGNCQTSTVLQVVCWRSSCSSWWRACWRM